MPCIDVLVVIEINIDPIEEKRLVHDIGEPLGSSFLHPSFDTIPANNAGFDATSVEFVSFARALDAHFKVQEHGSVH